MFAIQLTETDNSLIYTVGIVDGVLDVDETRVDYENDACEGCESTLDEGERIKGARAKIEVVRKIYE